MATKTARKASKKAEEGTAKLKPLDLRRLTFRIIGVTPLITHKWSEKAARMIREKKQGRATKDREPSNPKKEAEAATYYTAKGKYGIPAVGIKAAMISAAHKDSGIPKTLIYKGLYIVSDELGLVEIQTKGKPIIREDKVKVGTGLHKSADLRYRPMFKNWSITIECIVDTAMLRIDDILTLLNRAGFGVGLGEWRPEKGGDFGRFAVDRKFKIKQEPYKGGVWT